MPWATVSGRDVSHIFAAKSVGMCFNLDCNQTYTVIIHLYLWDRESIYHIGGIVTP